MNDQATEESAGRRMFRIWEWLAAERGDTRVANDCKSEVDLGIKEEREGAVR